MKVHLDMKLELTEEEKRNDPNPKGDKQGSYEYEGVLVCGFDGEKTATLTAGTIHHAMIGHAITSTLAKLGRNELDAFMAGCLDVLREQIMGGGKHDDPS